jgi:hypothetical protein
MMKKYIFLLVLLLTCSCVIQPDATTFDQDQTHPVGEHHNISTEDIDQNNEVPAYQETCSLDRTTALGEESQQFIVATHDTLESTRSTSYLYLCEIDGTCSKIYETRSLISSICDVKLCKRHLLFISILEGNSLVLHGLELGEPNYEFNIEHMGYSYFQDLKDSLVLYTNQKESTPLITQLYTYNLDTEHKEELHVPCEVFSAKFGRRENEILFNGVCVSTKALFSYNITDEKINIILDFPIDQFSISATGSTIVYNYFDETAHLEIFKVVENKRETNSEISNSSSFFSQWINSGQLLFTKKTAGNLVGFFVWKIEENKVDETQIGSNAIAISKNLDYVVTSSDGDGLRIFNVNTNESVNIIYPKDRKAYLAYFLGLDK